MPIKHPSKHYIHYLLSRRSLTPSQIVDRLRALDLPAPPKDGNNPSELEQQIAETKAEMRIPFGFSPRDPEHTESVEFLRRWGISDIWAGGPYMKHARALLDDPVPRRMACTLLLAPLTMKAISARIRNRFRKTEMEMNPRVLKLFSHYFWDYSAIDRDHWAYVLTAWVPGRTEDMMAALKAPRTQGGAALAITIADQSGSGETPSAIIYSTAREMAFQMFMSHALGRSHAANTLGALQALDMIIKADTELDKRRGGSSDLLDELERIEIIYDRPHAVSAGELYTNPAIPEKSIIDVAPDEGRESR